MGEVEIPDGVYWGAQTQRALENFRISDLRFSKNFIRAMASIKLVSARVNSELGVLDERKGGAIRAAALEIVEGKFRDNFPIDIFQTGSATSTNMNVNEVIAHRANEILGENTVHPNDHVNMSQSSNDVVPSAIHMVALEALVLNLLPSMKELYAALNDRANDFSDVVKIGRTHLQDALPITLGQEFSSYGSALEHHMNSLVKTEHQLGELALGGTAVGTGINAPEGFRDRVIKELKDITGLKLRTADNLFETMAFRSGVTSLSGEMKSLSTTLLKVSNDLRLLSSGPRGGIGEISLKPLQPGSSIMPGKVNPVIPEAVSQVCARVMGNDMTITLASSMGSLELNTMMPVMEYCVEESLHILAGGCRAMADCVRGIEANRERCRELAEGSLALVTVLTPHIGYEMAAEIAKNAARSGKSIKEAALEMGVLKEKELNRLLDPANMVDRPTKETK